MPIADRPVHTQEEERARFEMMMLLRQYPGPCGRRMYEEKGDTSWVDTLAEAKRRIIERHLVSVDTLNAKERQ